MPAFSLKNNDSIYHSLNTHGSTYKTNALIGHFLFITFNITIGRSDDTVGEFGLFHTMCTPAYDSAYRKDRRIQHFIYSQYLIDKS